MMLGILLGFAQGGRCERIKDIVDIEGIRGNPLSGVGLVIGLAGTGDYYAGVASDADKYTDGIPGLCFRPRI